MKAAVARIDGHIAVIITEGEIPITFNLPASFLGDAREGDIVDITITRDPEGTKATPEGLSSLIEKFKQRSKG